MARNILAQAEAFRTTLQGLKEREPVDFPWYPYDSMSNFHHLERLLQRPLEEFLGQFPAGSRIIDIACADGDTAFFLETLGYAVDALDFAPTNQNGMKAIRHLKRRLDSRVSIIEHDIDGGEALRGQYSIALGLGLLYHLRNPLLFLDRVRAISEYLFLSTRIASHAPNDTPLAELPVAYLLDFTELNNDATNYWIFSRKGMERLASRAGWDVLNTLHLGAVNRSYPHLNSADERLFMLLKRRA